MARLRVIGMIAALGVVVGGGFAYRTFGAFLPWREEAEAERLAVVARITTGQSVAEIGAGSGRFTVSIARKVGNEGRVFSTELSAENLDAIRRRAADAGLHNVTVVEAGPTETNLPDACCDVIFMRNVYHHIGEPDAFAAAVCRAVRAGGRLVVIDFDPAALWCLGGRPDGAPERRAGHGVGRNDAIAELTARGFRLERNIPNWSGPLWLVIFERPATN